MFKQSDEKHEPENESENSGDTTVNLSDDDLKALAGGSAPPAAEATAAGQSTTTMTRPIGTMGANGP